MMALSIRNPSATLLAHGWLTTNTRWFAPAHRGAVAIHASRGLGPRQLDDFNRPAVRSALRKLVGHADPDSLPAGCVVGVARLAGVTAVDDLFAGATIPPNDAVLLPKIAGGYLLRFTDALPIDPVPCPAEPDLFELPPHTLSAVLRNMEHCRALLNTAG